MKKQLLLSDILFLLKLLTPKNSALFIFDPLERLIFNVDFPLRVVANNSFNVLVNFSDEHNCYNKMPLNEFDLVFNFYSPSILTTSRITRTIKTLVRLGFSSAVRPSSFSIYHPIKLVSQVPYDEYSITMDAIGVSRTVLLKLFNNFSKIPIGKQSKKPEKLSMKVC